MVRWRTGDEITEGGNIATLFVPPDVWLRHALVSALEELTQGWNWETVGAVSADDAAEAGADILESLDLDADRFLSGELLLTDFDGVLLTDFDDVVLYEVDDG